MIENAESASCFFGRDERALHNCVSEFADRLLQRKHTWQRRIGRFLLTVSPSEGEQPGQEATRTAQNPTCNCRRGGRCFESLEWASERASEPLELGDLRSFPPMPRGKPRSYQQHVRSCCRLPLLFRPLVFRISNAPWKNKAYTYVHVERIEG